MASQVFIWLPSVSVGTSDCPPSYQSKGYRPISKWLEGASEKSRRKGFFQWRKGILEILNVWNISEDSLPPCQSPSTLLSFPSEHFEMRLPGYSLLCSSSI